MPEEFVGRKFYPTSVRKPAWATGLVARVSKITDLKVEEARTVKAKFEKPTGAKGLMRSKTFETWPVSLASEDYDTLVVEEVPETPGDVVPWMHQAATANAVLEARCEEYNRLGSQLVSASGDGNIPGISLEDLNYSRTTGATVTAQGYGSLVTPYGTLRVPVGGKTDGIFPNLLCWGAIPRTTFFYQWTGALLKWKSLASTPIESALGFPNCWGLVAPQYFVVASSRPAMFVRTFLTLGSNKQQTVKLTVRDTDDFTKTMFTSDLSVPEGETMFTILLRGAPIVPASVFHLQPEDGTQTYIKEATTKP
ncbi:MAG: hypothetical protein QW356_04645 [Candidatus Hadarchaeales archaeon]